MNRRALAWPMLIALSLLLPWLLGCGVSDNAKNGSGPRAAQGNQKKQKGPHGGKLYPLGDDGSLYAELVKDYEADRVIVYILTAARVPYPNTAEDVTLVITGPFAGSGAFLLRPPNRTSGMSAQFELVEPRMEQQLEADGIEVELHITIDGRKYVGGRQYGVE